MLYSIFNDNPKIDYILYPMIRCRFEFSTKLSMKSISIYYGNELKETTEAHYIEAQYMRSKQISKAEWLDTSAMHDNSTEKRPRTPNTICYLAVRHVFISSLFFLSP